MIKFFLSASILFFLIIYNAAFSFAFEWEYGSIEMYIVGDGNSSTLIRWNDPDGTYIQKSWESRENIEKFLASLNNGESVRWAPGKVGLFTSMLNILGKNGWELIESQSMIENRTGVDVRIEALYLKRQLK